MRIAHLLRATGKSSFCSRDKPALSFSSTESLWTFYVSPAGANLAGDDNLDAALLEAGNVLRRDPIIGDERVHELHTTQR